VGNFIAHVVNKQIEEKGSQDRSLGNTGENSKRRGKNTRNKDMRFPVGQVTAKPVYIATRKPKNTKLIIIIQFSSLLYYSCAESTATRPITDTAQCRYRYLHYGQTLHKVEDRLQGNTGGNNTLIQKVNKQTRNKQR
jgi:hypothetical protein